MDHPEGVLPIIEEELVTGVKPVTTGSVRVRKEVEHVHKTVEGTAIRDVLRVRRVPINRVVDSMPQLREEGNTVIVPVVEEEIVVQKRLVLKEEIHIERHRTRARVSKPVTLDREHAVVERLDSSGTIKRRSVT